MIRTRQNQTAIKPKPTAAIAAVVFAIALFPAAAAVRRQMEPLTADIDPRHLGEEMWSGPAGLRACKGKRLGPAPRTANFAIWWDGDLLRELLDRNPISKWNWTNASLETVLAAAGCSSNNGSKAAPCLSADILGDWREEVIFRTPDNTELRIYTTTIPTEHRLPTLMSDPQYRLSVAWQNLGYNQPPHPGFFPGSGMKSATTP